MTYKELIAEKVGVLKLGNTGTEINASLFGRRLYLRIINKDENFKVELNENSVLTQTISVGALNTNEAIANTICNRLKLEKDADVR